MPLTTAKKTGFTLIELSIVLVIIALIIGGILTGQELVSAAYIRKTATDLVKYQTAMATFSTKYNCIAGDCSSANMFFGTDNSGCPHNLNSGGSNTGVCNGDGNGLINGWSNGSTVNVENIFVWEELSYANMIPSMDVGPIMLPGQSWDMTKGGPTWISKVIGYNVPASAYSGNVGYNMMSADPTLTSWGYYPPVVTSGQLMIEIGGVSSNNAEFLNGSGFTAPQALQLDKKMDDGMPSSGAISAISLGYTAPGNSNTTCLSGTSYSNSNATGCVVYFLLKL